MAEYKRYRSDQKKTTPAPVTPPAQVDPTTTPDVPPVTSQPPTKANRGKSYTLRDAAKTEMNIMLKEVSQSTDYKQEYGAFVYSVEENGETRYYVSDIIRGTGNFVYHSDVKKEMQRLGLAIETTAIDFSHTHMHYDEKANKPSSETVLINRGNGTTESFTIENTHMSDDDVRIVGNKMMGNGIKINSFTALIPQGAPQYNSPTKNIQWFKEEY